ncbi:MAG: RPC7 family DNA-directed RNA polymerase III subunit [Phycisphaerales bacterium]
MLRLFPDLWRSMDDTTGAGRGGRLIMLGTPNHGSFAASLALSGAEEQLKRLAFVDLDHSLADIQRIVCRFAGCYQMLPSPLLDFDDDRRALYDWVAWGPHPVEADLLARAERFHDELRAAVDPARMIYVAGFDVETPSRVRVRRAGVFAYESTRDGDGRVPHGLGRLDGVPMHWVRRGVHGDLPMNGLVLDAIDQLLHSGSSGICPPATSIPPTRRRVPRQVGSRRGRQRVRAGGGEACGSGRTSKGRQVAIAAPDRVDHVDGDEFHKRARKARTAQQTRRVDMSPRMRRALGKRAPCRLVRKRGASALRGEGDDEDQTEGEDQDEGEDQGEGDAEDHCEDKDEDDAALEARGEGRVPTQAFVAAPRLMRACGGAVAHRRGRSGRGPAGRGVVRRRTCREPTCGHRPYDGS